MDVFIGYYTDMTNLIGIIGVIAVVVGFTIGLTDAAVRRDKANIELGYTTIAIGFAICVIAFIVVSAIRTSNISSAVGEIEQAYGIEAVEPQINDTVLNARRGTACTTFEAYHQQDNVYTRATFCIVMSAVENNNNTVHVEIYEQSATGTGYEKLTPRQ